MGPLKLLAATVAGLAVAGLSAAQPGQLVQLTGSGACASQLDTRGVCADGRALNAPGDVALSPDGRFVYIASFGVGPRVSGNQGAVAVLARSARDGRIAQAAGPEGCVSETEDSCRRARAVGGVSGVTVSPDGRHVYATGHFSGSVAAFARSTSGALAQLPGPGGCQNGDGSTACGIAGGLDGATDLAVSRDGRNLYV
jgi:DNA-binding beta-propeller fold protein YncE